MSLAVANLNQVNLSSGAYSRVDWLAAAQLTWWSLATTVIFSDLGQLVLISAGQLLLAVVLVRSSKPALITIKLGSLFVLPVILIHTFLNPVFPATTYFFAAIPFRLAGLEYSLVISIRVVVLFTGATVWLFVDRDRFVVDLINLRAPLFVLIPGALASSLLTQMVRRVHTIRAAQQARGIDLSSNILARLRALPRIMIPLFVSTISEAEMRATALAVRGIGAVRPMPWNARRLTLLDFLPTLVFAALILIVTSLR